MTIDDLTFRTYSANGDVMIEIVNKSNNDRQLFTVMELNDQRVETILRCRSLHDKMTYVVYLSEGVKHLGVFLPSLSINYTPEQIVAFSNVIPIVGRSFSVLGYGSISVEQIGGYQHLLVGDYIAYSTNIDESPYEDIVYDHDDYDTAVKHAFTILLE